MDNPSQNKISNDIFLTRQQDCFDKIRNIRPTEDALIRLLDPNDGELGKVLVDDWQDLVKNLYNGKISEEIISSCLMESNLMLELAWEKLNTGNWKNVPMAWRRFYTLVSSVKVYATIEEISNRICTFEDAIALIKACDMGLLMGSPISQVKLTDIASILQSFLWKCSKEESHQIDSKLDTPSKKKRFDLDSYSEAWEIVQDLPRVSCPSLVKFSEIISSGKPVILTDCINHWPALTSHRWTLNYIRSVAGFRTVPVEIGSSYAEETWSQKLMSINEFIDRFFPSGCPDTPRGYLAQHQLFNQIPELADDILTPDYCSLSDADDQDQVDVNAWFGPALTVSPLHTDIKQNLLVQVNGDKYVRLYSARQSEFVYPHQGSFLSNTSQVDIEKPDLEKFPKFKEALGWHGFLRSGEMLYIPEKCWHYVRSLSPSFSVNFWWI